MFLSRWFQRWRTPVAFPVETFRHILSYADTGTLAVCCRVNFTLLELASEILYDEVEVVGLERLRQLFNQSDQSYPRVNAYLSLQRIRTFTFVADSFRDRWIPKLLTRRRGQSPLEVETLIVRVQSFRMPATLLDLRFPVVAQKLHRFLFPHFDPRFFHFHPVPDPRGLSAAFLITSPGGQQDWTRLESVKLVQSSISPRPAGQEQWVISASLRGGQLTLELPTPFLLDIDLGPDGPSAELESFVSTYVGQTPFLTRGEGSVFARVELVVPSEEVRDAAVGYIKSVASWPGAIGEAQVQSDLDAGRLSVVVRDLSDIHTFRPAQVPRMLRIDEPRHPAPGAGSYVLPPPGLSSNHRTRQIMADSHLDFDTFVKACVSFAFMLWFWLYLVFPMVFRIARLVLSIIVNVPDNRFKTTEHIIDVFLIGLVLRAIIITIPGLARSDAAASLEKVPVFAFLIGSILFVVVIGL